MMIMMTAMALATATAEDAEPWKDEAVCAWLPGMKEIAMVQARTRKVWSGTSYRVEGLLTINGKDVSYADLVKESEHAPWAKDDTMTFKGHTYAKYGFPRILQASDTVPIGDLDGVAVTKEPSAADVPEVVYVMHRGLMCEFQPYELKG